MYTTDGFHSGLHELLTVIIEYYVVYMVHSPDLMDYFVLDELHVTCAPDQNE